PATCTLSLRDALPICRRDWSALAGCLAVVAAIAVGLGDREEGVPMGYADVAVGQTGASSTFSARVLDVQVGRQVQKDEYSEPLVDRKSTRLNSSHVKI